MDVTKNISTTPAEFDNATTCLNKSLQLEKLFPLYLAHIQVACFLIFVILGIPLNCYIIYLVSNLPRFHTEFAFSLQVVVVDILLALCLPFAIGNLMGGSPLLVPAECNVMGFIKLFLRLVRYIMFCIIPLDRFSLVFFPFSYPPYRRRTAIFLCIIAWTSSALIACLPLTANCYGYLPTFGFCMLMAYCSTTCRGLTIGIESLMIVLGGIVPGVLFSLVFCVAMRKERSNSSPTPQLQSETRSRLQATYILVLLHLIMSSVPLVILVLWESLDYQGEDAYEYWIFLGLSMTTLEAVVVVSDPIVMMRNGQLQPAVKALTASAKDRVRTRCCCK